MTELIMKIAQDESLQEQIRACTDAKAFAALTELDEAQAEQIFPQVREIMADDKVKVPDDLMEKISGGTGCRDSNPAWGENGFLTPHK